MLATPDSRISRANRQGMSVGSGREGKDSTSHHLFFSFFVYTISQRHLFNF